MSEETLESLWRALLEKQAWYFSALRDLEEQSNKLSDFPDRGYYMSREQDVLERQEHVYRVAFDAYVRALVAP